MANVLGISCFYHDSAAALVVDGRVMAAAQEERFSRIKHDPSFPSQAIAYCLKVGTVLPRQLDFVAYYEKPHLKFERLISSYLHTAPSGCRQFVAAMEQWVPKKLTLLRSLRKSCGVNSETPVVAWNHHLSHAASAFFPSPFDKAAILTIDGVGEWDTTCLGIGSGKELRLLQGLRFPHSVGLLYSAFTEYCGFKVNDGEYKLMGLAPYGRPRFAERIRRHLIEVNEDGSFTLNLRCFHFLHGFSMINKEFCNLFGVPKRRRCDALEQIHADLAASIQEVTEQIVLKLARTVRKLSGCGNLVIAGGVGLNCVANTKILEEGIFDAVWVQPAAGDAGGALGAAILTSFQMAGDARRIEGRDGQRGSLLGPAFSNNEIERALQSRSLPYERKGTDRELCQSVAAMLDSGMVVGWFQGRMEFGPRALGSRSILADARRTDMPSVLNRKIKFREGFRPFAPAVLYELMNELFVVPTGIHPAYMTFVARSRAFSGNVVSDRPADSPIDLRPELVAKGGSSVPAVTHLDGTSRIQAVEANMNPLFYGLIQEFYARTHCPAIINTSFNRDGEPIVCTPEDAIRCFLGSGIDALAIGNCLVIKDANRGARQEDAVNELNADQKAAPKGWLLMAWSRFAVFTTAYFVFLFPLAMALRMLRRDPLRVRRNKGDSCFAALGERLPVRK